MKSIYLSLLAILIGFSLSCKHKPDAKIFFYTISNTYNLSRSVVEKFDGLQNIKGIQQIKYLKKNFNRMNGLLSVSYNYLVIQIKLKEKIFIKNLNLLVTDEEGTLITTFNDQINLHTNRVFSVLSLIKAKGKTGVFKVSCILNDDFKFNQIIIRK